jgi:hypothetical protein
MGSNPAAGDARHAVLLARGLERHMSSPSFTFGGPFTARRNGLQVGLGLMQTWLDVRATAQQQFLSEVRRCVGGSSLVNASIDFAEMVARQQRDFGNSVIDRLGSSLTPAQFGPAAAGAEPATDGPPPGPTAVRSSADHSPEAQNGSVIRLSVPYGKRGVAVPLQLQNHRDAIDFVTFSAGPPRFVGVPTIHPSLIRFHPDSIGVEPRADSLVELLIDVPPDAVPDTTYWAEIVLAGAETRRFPLALEIGAESEPI